MSLRRFSVLAVVLGFAACADNTAPEVEGLALARGGNGGGRSTATEIPTTDSSATTDTSTGTVACPYTDVPDGEPCVLRHSVDAPPLATLSTSFTVVQGRRKKFDFAYSTGEWYGGVVIPKDAQLLDESGRPLERGESVQVTVEFDPDRYLVRFGPHGSTFVNGNPVQLVFNLDYADLGNADLTEADIWYQPNADTEWGALTSTIVSVSSSEIWVHIRHFSNYAVAW